MKLRLQSLWVIHLCLSLSTREWKGNSNKSEWIYITKVLICIIFSTLSWARVEDIVSGRIPTSRLVLVEDSAVCRVRDGNEQRAGRTDLSGSCLAGPGLKKHTEYQVVFWETILSHDSFFFQLSGIVRKIKILCS